MSIRELDGAEALARVDELAEVLRDCVEGGASVGFMLPLAEGRPEAFWRKVAAGVASGERHLFVAEDAAGRICGTLSLVIDMPDNQPHRADVSKMLVHRRARRQGVAERLLSALEVRAHDLGRTTLVLDTVTSSDASRVYERTGWQKAGDIPNYALMPDGPLCSTTYYFKKSERVRPGGTDASECVAGHPPQHGVDDEATTLGLSGHDDPRAADGRCADLEPG